MYTQKTDKRTRLVNELSNCYYKNRGKLLGYAYKRLDEHFDNIDIYVDNLVDQTYKISIDDKKLKTLKFLGDTESKRSNKIYGFLFACLKNNCTRFIAEKTIEDKYPPLTPDERSSQHRLIKKIVNTARPETNIVGIEYKNGSITLKYKQDTKIDTSGMSKRRLARARVKNSTKSE